MSQSQWQQIREHASALLSQSSFINQSAAYYQWRHQFVRSRLRLGVWLAIAAELFLLATKVLLESPLTRLSEQASFYISLVEITENLQPIALTIACLLMFQQLLKHSKIQHSPIKLLPLFTFIVLVVGSTLYQPSGTQQFSSEVVTDIAIVFWCQAIVIPVQWRSHLVAQLLSTCFIFSVCFFALIGQFGLSALPAILLDMSWGALYCLLVIASENFMVSYAEQLTRREFNLCEQIEISLKTVSKDLRQPILHNQQLLRKLQILAPLPSKSNSSIRISTATVQQLLDNSNHQLSLLNKLLIVADYHG